jgi:Bax inhibitor 1 like protein
LSQQQIGVFVRAALPGTLRIAEVDLDVGGYCEGLVLMATLVWMYLKILRLLSKMRERW